MNESAFFDDFGNPSIPAGPRARAVWGPPNPENPPSWQKRSILSGKCKNAHFRRFLAGSPRNSCRKTRFSDWGPLFAQFAIKWKAWTLPCLCAAVLKPIRIIIHHHSGDIIYR